jgi:hypothetical protein
VEAGVWQTIDDVHTSLSILLEAILVFGSVPGSTVEYQELWEEKETIRLNRLD